MPRFQALVRDGKLVPLEPKRLARYEGRDVWVEIHRGPTVGVRSNSANAYLWGVCYAEICAQTGNDPESVHLALKREAVRLGILEPQRVLVGDQLLESEPTTKTDEDTFARYVNWVKDFALHKLGVVIPED